MEQDKAQDNLVPIHPKKTRVRKTVRKGVEIIVEKPEKTKLDLFLEEYVKNNGNGTAAAMKVFDVKNKVNAANIASQYLKKAQNANRLLMEKKGYTQGRMMDIALTKMQAARTPEWWDRLMKMAGYEDFLSKTPVTKATIAIMEVQKEVMDEYIIEGETVDG